MSRDTKGQFIARDGSPHNDLVDLWHHEYKQARVRLDELEAQQRWISVNERLPVEGQNVITAWANGDVTGVMCIVDWRNETDAAEVHHKPGRYWQDDDCRGPDDPIPDGEILSWMPLPVHPDPEALFKKAIQGEVDMNMQTFLVDLDAIYKDHADQWALMRQRKIVEYFDTSSDAVKYAEVMFSDRIFSVQEVTHRTVHV